MALGLVGGESLSGLRFGVGMRLAVGRCRVARRVLPGGGGLGGLDELGGHLVVGVGGLKPPLAGGAGLVGAVGAGGGSVALVVGSFAQGGQQELDLAGRDDDGAWAGRLMAGHVFFLAWRGRAGGWMSGAIPVPVAGFQPLAGR